MAFTWVANLAGGRPLLYEFFSKDTESLHEGDFMNAESGEVDLGATNDMTFAGVLAAAVDPASYERAAGANYGRINATDSTTNLLVEVSPWAIYTDGVTGTARAAGDTLDLSGATGAQVLAASSNVDFTVIRSSGTGENPLVKVAPGEHYLDP